MPALGGLTTAATSPTGTLSVRTKRSFVGSSIERSDTAATAALSNDALCRLTHSVLPTITRISLTYSCLIDIIILILFAPVILHKQYFFMTSGFSRDVDDICALLGYYAASNDNFLRRFGENVSVPSLRIKKSEKKSFSSWTS
jgi:hypothetical protein